MERGRRGEGVRRLFCTVGGEGLRSRSIRRRLRRFWLSNSSFCCCVVRPKSCRNSSFWGAEGESRAGSPPGRSSSPSLTPGTSAAGWGRWGTGSWCHEEGLLPGGTGGQGAASAPLYLGGRVQLQWGLLGHAAEMGPHLLLVAVVAGVVQVVVVTWGWGEAGVRLGRPRGPAGTPGNLLGPWGPRWGQGCSKVLVRGGMLGGVSGGGPAWVPAGPGGVTQQRFVPPLPSRGPWGASPTPASPLGITLGRVAGAQQAGGGCG